MNPAVRMERGHYLIDTDAWVEQRVGGCADAFTALLREFTGHDLFREQVTSMNMSSRVVLWCTARGWPVSDSSPLHHDNERLTRPVSIILAAAPGATTQPVAIVIVDDRDPVVYLDITTDEDSWHQVATVDIVCPTGHRLTWDGGRGLVDHEGADTTIAAMFGPDPQAPLRPCRACSVYQDCDTFLDCDCGGVSAIYCPVCGARCSLALPGIGIHQGRRRETP